MTDMAPEGDDVTIQELERNLGVRGYDTEVVVVPGALRCEACGTPSAVSEWTVDEVRRGSSGTAVEPEQVAAALRCPSCHRPGRVLVDAGSELAGDLERSVR